MNINFNNNRIGLYMTLLTVLAAFTLSGCAGTGPTKRYVEGAWNVSENICTSDPDQPDKGDMTSIIRVNSNDSTNAQRKVKIAYLDKTILELDNNFNRSGVTGEMTTYNNSTENDVKSVKRAINRNEINAGIAQAFEEFFADDPAIDGKRANSFCLYRGQ